MRGAESVKLRRLNPLVPETLHREVKVRAAEMDTTVQEFTRQALIAALAATMPNGGDGSSHESFARESA